MTSREKHLKMIFDNGSDSEYGLVSAAFKITDKELAEKQDEIERLRETLRDALCNLVDWDNYIDEYFKAKHGFDEDIKQIENALK